MENWIPDRGGIEATHTIKGDASFNHTPVILFSANKDVKKLANESQADGFLEKPFSLTQLEEVIENVLSK